MHMFAGKLETWADLQLVSHHCCEPSKHGLELALPAQSSGGLVHCSFWAQSKLMLFSASLPLTAPLESCQ